MVSKQRDSTNPVREGFLEYAAGAVAKREFQAKGNYTLEGGREEGRQPRLSGMEWGEGRVDCAGL